MTNLLLQQKIIYIYISIVNYAKLSKEYTKALSVLRRVPRLRECKGSMLLLHKGVVHVQVDVYRFASCSNSHTRVYT
jgi:hypothetical protein